MPDPILTEYGLGERLTQTDLNRFIDQGIPPIYLARTWSGTFAFLQRDRVRVDGDRLEFARYSMNKSDSADAILSALADKAQDGTISNRRMSVFKLRNGRAARLSRSSSCPFR